MIALCLYTINGDRIFNFFRFSVVPTAVTVKLEPDVAKVFQTSEAVNKALRAILSPIPQK